MVEKSGNPVLDKNLEYIAKYNPKLAEDVLGLRGLNNSIQLIETQLKEPNLTYNNLALHSQNGAEIEAKAAFNSVTNTPLSAHILYGIGLGHVFKEFCENSKGQVFLYEPNLEILRVTLELVDFSEVLSKSNVMVFSDIPSFKLGFAAKYKYKEEVSFTYLGSYKEIYGEELMNTFKHIETIAGACIVDYNTLLQDGVRSITTTLDNLVYTLDATPLYEFKDIYKGKTALIVSAGPSLDACVETIKENRDKVVIFCVGTAFKVLANNGIKPDFLNIIEINDCSEQVKGFDLSDINLILEPYTNNVFYKLKVNQRILFPANTAHANNYWASLTGVDLAPYISKGTVSYESLYTAKILGCSKIILVGQDLAYVDNKCYSGGTAYAELACEVNPETGKTEFVVKDYDKYVESLLSIGVETPEDWYKEFVETKLANMNSTLTFVKGISGEALPTQASYSVFIEHFRDFAIFNKDLELINTSMRGSQIDGFENMPLEKALENAPVIEKIELPKNFKYDKKKILENLEHEIKILKSALNEFPKAKEYTLKYDREFQRRRAITTESTKFFKLLLSLYEKITVEYYKRDPLYQILAFNQDVEVQYAVTGTEKVDIERIKVVYALLKDYYREVEIKVLDTLEKIDQQKGIISESINSES